MREVDGVPFVQACLDGRPNGFLGGVGDQHLHDGALLGRFLDVKEGLARLPAVAHRPVPVLLELFGLADNHVETVIPHVQRLSGSLHAVADHGNGLVLQYIAGLLQGEFVPHDHPFDHSTKIYLSHESLLCLVVGLLSQLFLQNPVNSHKSAPLSRWGRPQAKACGSDGSHDRETA